MSSLAIAYLTALVEHPVQTKSLTSGTLNGLSELLASVISGTKDPRKNSYFNSRIIKMALYGFLVSGPLSHYLVDLVQRAFRKSRKGWATNVAQIIVLNLVVNPIMAVTFISWMSIIAGARSFTEIKARVQKSLLPVLRSQWVSSPILIAFAQRYIPKIAWTPTFSFFASLLSTYHNVLVRKHIAQNKKKDE